MTREMQMKATLKDYLIGIRLAKLTKKENSNSGNITEKQTL